MKLILNKSLFLFSAFQIQGLRQAMLENWIDQDAIKTWHYPINFSVRSYQRNIVQQCLFKNTLVSLPTGTGKTFIAGVVMLNFLRWFPFGKICFLAPTKPLVAQQLEACKGVGIDDSCMIELTGNISPSRRLELWKSKRIFFMTPQILHNDIEKQICPTQFIVCVIVDESHRAQGKHSYCEGIRLLSERNPAFRVVALTATPASNSQAVQKIIDNLLIAHVEIRTEESIDVRPYMHQKKIESVLVDLGEDLLKIRAIVEKELILPFLNRLCDQGVLFEREPSRIGKAMLLRLRELFRQRVRNGAFVNGHSNGLIECDFAALLSFVHCYELLMVHGIFNFFNHLYFSFTDNSSKLKNFLSRNQIVVGTINGLKESFTSLSYNSILKSHPKMGHLEREVTLFLQQNPTSKVIIFAEYRDTVNQIVTLLQHHSSIIRVVSFVGKSDSKSSKGINQKEQIEIVTKFREGIYNVLVSTSIGEEGLDIGEVDLIVCYDAQTSPIRMLQRFGRTGRKRKGRVLMLLTKGREEHKHKQTNSSYKAVQNAISNRQLVLYDKNPRMIPIGINPEYQEIVIKSENEFSFDKSIDQQQTNESTESDQLMTPVFINQPEPIAKESDVCIVAKQPSCTSSISFDSPLQPTPLLITSGNQTNQSITIDKVKNILTTIYNRSTEDENDFSEQVSSLDLEMIPEIDQIFESFNQNNNSKVIVNLNCKEKEEISLIEDSLQENDNVSKDKSNIILRDDEFDSLEIPSDFFLDDWNVEKIESPRFIAKRGVNCKLFINSQQESSEVITSPFKSSSRKSPLSKTHYELNSQVLTSPLSSKSGGIKKNSKKHSFWAVGNFLDVEAERSQDYCSTDAQNSGIDEEEYDEMSSFINDSCEDGSESSEQSQGLDFYRQSILMSQVPEFEGRANKFGKDGRFKLVR